MNAAASEVAVNAASEVAMNAASEVDLHGIDTQTYLFIVVVGAASTRRRLVVDSAREGLLPFSRTHFP